VAGLVGSDWARAGLLAQTCRALGRSVGRGRGLGSLGGSGAVDAGRLGRGRPFPGLGRSARQGRDGSLAVGCRGEGDETREKREGRGSMCGGDGLGRRASRGGGGLEVETGARARVLGSWAPSGP
jgi:hypothetical protein